MKQERFQEIDTLKLTQGEVSEYFQIKRKKEALAENSEFPFKILYADGNFTQEILPDGNPLAAEIEGCLFALCVSQMSEMGAYFLDGRDFDVGTKVYVTKLPTIEQLGLLSVYEKEWQLCLQLLNAVFDRQEKFAGCKKFWVWDDHGKIACVQPSGQCSPSQDNLEHSAVFVLQ